MAGIDGGFRQFSMLKPKVLGWKSAVSLAGATASVALVVALAVWGYRLAVRDVSGVPVVRAIEGAMRVAPDHPGGDIADHQGLAVNEVAAIGTAAQPPDRLVLAPRPMDLALDDMAGLGPLNVPDTNSVVADSLQTALQPLPSAEALQTEDAIAMALAEALADEDGAALSADAVDANLPQGAVARSPRPIARPDARMADVETTAAATALPVVEIDPDSLAAGTRLVQFGAYDSPEAARAEWVVLQGRFGDLMSGKEMVVEQAISGGEQFWRLRANGFDDEVASRRFCSALKSENTPCLPVEHR
jgi:SPOR domain